MINDQFFVFFETAFLSVLVFQFLFISIQAYYIRSPEYYYYASYILLIFIYTLSLGKVTPYLPDSFTLSDHVRYFLDKPVIAFSFFVYFRFARFFMDIPDKFPGFNSRIKLFEWIALGYACFEMLWLMLFGKSLVEEILFIITYALMMFFSLNMIIRFLNMQRVQLTRFILMGAFLLLMGSMGSLVLFNLINLNMVSDTLLPIFPFQIGVMGELLVFTTGLAFKQRLAANQKLRAEQELIKELLEKDALQQNLQQLRNKIAGDLHDDVGATLGSINVYADVSERMMNEGNNADAKEYLKRIVELSKDSLNDMRHMIWALNPGFDTIDDLEIRMTDYATPLLTAKNISFSFQTDENLHHHKISVIQKRNLFLIFKEAIHNVIKYAACNHVAIKIFALQNQFCFCLVDDGKGFDIHLKNEGNGLSNMKRRALELNADFEIKSSSLGTSIQLIF